jgi:GTPase
MAHNLWNRYFLKSAHTFDIMSGDSFIDYVKICCRSGHGGAGSMHFHRDKNTAKGGPDGGDGGRGGHIILRGNKQMWTLLHLKYRKHVIAGVGESGKSGRKHGKDGEDVILDVPLGTIAKDAETDEFLVEIVEDGQEYVIAPGGRGGLGNEHFKSPTNQTPMYSQPGLPGEEKWKILELKVLADVGLVGFPNAGKSTLLSVLSAAKPEIADYPFTTLVPNLGIVNYRDELSFVMADIPGIIEGASQGKGLGYRFLRHIERNSVLLFMVPADAKDIQEAYNILCKELEAYNPELMHKQRLLAITKSDLLDEELKGEMAKTLPKDVACLFISSVAQIGLQELKDALWKMMNHEQTGNQTTI